MRITYLLGSIGFTGGNVVLFNHMEALAQDGHDVVMITPFSTTKWHPGMLSEIFNKRELGYAGLWGLLKSTQKKVRSHAPLLENKISSLLRGDAYSYSFKITQNLLSRWEPSDITIATHSITAHAAALLSKETKVFYHMQGYEPWFTEDIDYKRIASLSYTYPINLIANCQWLRNKISQETGRDPNSISLVRPGLDHKTFYPRNRNLRNDNSRIKIVSYADSRPLKGWSESKAAMKKVFQQLESSYEIEWHVFGSINDDNFDYPINYHGFLSHEELSALYSEADFIFVPSWFESFPLQPVEAMACGAAVITTNIGTEDYARDGETALVIEPKNIEALAQAILKLIKDDNLRNKLSVNGLLEAKNYTWEQSADEIKRSLGLVK
tara:strand:+ start:18550 stop:19695 length:1146 start_codon:yes stop_codon:yes gene_type:complete